MTESSSQDDAVGLLTELGFNEYEARCFVALTRFPTATAKELSDASGVPRTRVYDAVRTLEDDGLVEVQHTNPKRFRAVSVEEAVGTLQRGFHDRIETLADTLEALEPIEQSTDDERIEEVWALSSHSGVESRLERLIEDATDRIVIAVGAAGDVATFPLGLIRTARDRDVDVVIGVTTPDERDRIAEAIPTATVVVTEPGWLATVPSSEASAISRVLLVDDDVVLVAASDDDGERAVFARGPTSGLVILVRQLLTAWLPADDIT